MLKLILYIFICFVVKMIKKVILQSYRTYLRNIDLFGLELYEYNAEETSSRIFILQSYWDYLIKYVPWSVAPNLLAMYGFICITSSYFLVSYFDYEFYASSELHPQQYDTIPKLVYLFVAAAIFVNHTLDGLHRKQIERTITHGPLREFFYYGLGSWTSFMVPCLLYSVFGRDPKYGISPFRLYCLLWNTFLNLYLSHVEKYVTGALYLPWSYDYAMLGVVFLFTCASILGFHGWKFTVIGKFTVANVLEGIFYCGTILINIPAIAWKFYKYYEKPSVIRHLTYFEASKPLFPFMFMMVLFLVWVLYSPTNILQRDPRAIYYVTGTLLSNISCRLIASQMSGAECNIFQWLMVPPVICFCIAFVLPISELFLMHFLVVFISIFHVHYGVCVAWQMCLYFRIKCFEIIRKSK